MCSSDLTLKNYRTGCGNVSYVHPDDQTQPTFESELSYNIRGTFSYTTEDVTLMSSVTNFDILKKKRMC